MFDVWSRLRKGTSPVDAGPAVPWSASEEPAPRSSPHLAGGGPLDTLGQQSESVRDKVNRMAERLDELRSLSSEFGQIVAPLNDFVDQHAASRAKLMEVEALLTRERELSGSARAELSALQVMSARTFGDLQDALAALTDREASIRRQETEITELRIRVSDFKSHADSLDSRLFAEVDRAKALTDDNASLRQDIVSAEDARVATERSLVESRESFGLVEAEASRLQALTESMALKISGLNRTVSELEPQLQMARSTAALVQGKFAVEQSARQKSEAARDVERAAHEMELASLSMKIDGLNAHGANTEKLLAHLRDQLHDRSEAFRVAEKGLRDATTEKISLERRLESALEASARTAAQLQDAQRVGLDLGNRCDMLVKAVAAKDQALDSANRKSATLLDRIEQLNARFQLERSEFEATHRRMIEELQNERAERSLAHGALDIARKSRSSLLAQYTALKRRTGAVDAPAPDDGEPGIGAPRPADSNVMAFNPPEAGH